MNAIIKLLLVETIIELLFFTKVNMKCTIFYFLFLKFNANKLSGFFEKVNTTGYSSYSPWNEKKDR